MALLAALSRDDADGAGPTKCIWAGEEALVMGILDGKVIIVTGGGNGIGRAAAMAAAREGAKVVVADVDSEGGALTTKLVEGAGGEALFVSTDVTKTAEVRALVDAAVKRFRHLDGAFNNAGIEGESAPVADYDEDSWRHVLDVDVTSVFRCMQAEIPALLRAGGGSIVNCSSVAGLVGFPSAPAYVAAKHGVVGLTKAAALDMAERRVRVNAVCPGIIDTDMVSRATGGDATALKALESMEPIGRMGRPSEVAELAVWLLSDRAGFVTGQAVAVDGGLVVR